MSRPGARKIMIGSVLGAVLFGAGCSTGAEPLSPPVDDKAVVRAAQAPTSAAAPSGATGADAGAGAYGGSGAAGAVDTNKATNALRVTSVGNLSDVVTDQDGFTLYRFDKDSNKPATSNCSGQCAEAWPPVIINGDVNIDINNIVVEGLDKSKLGVLDRPDGKKQLTLNNWPLYRFAKDTAPGQANGEGAQGTWWSIASTGVKSKDKGAAVAAGTTLIKAMDVVPFGKAVTDKEGFTLYRFEKDTPEPPASNCNGDCAKTWPPVLAEGNVVVEGIDKSLVGEVTRADGSKQVTVGGWPVYRYIKDTAPCQANGEGVGGTWFVIAPNGKKAKDVKATK